MKTTEEKQTIVEGYKKAMKPYMNENGCFPDSVLGDAVWPLRWCRKMTGPDGKLWWNFID